LFFFGEKFLAEFSLFLLKELETFICHDSYRLWLNSPLALPLSGVVLIIARRSQTL
jgi:hypothetical protein